MPSTYGHTERVLDAGPFGKDWRGDNPKPDYEWTPGEAFGFERVRMRCDRALQATKTLPTVPQRNESVTTYERRLLGELKAHAPSCKRYDFSWGTAEQVAEIAPKLLREAIEAPKRRGELVEIKLRDRSGRIVSEFEGSKSCWLGQFKAVPAGEGVYLDGKRQAIRAR